MFMGMGMFVRCNEGGSIVPCCYLDTNVLLAAICNM